MKTTLKIAWEKRAKLRAEGDKLRTEGDKLWDEGDKLRAEGDKLRAKGDKLWDEGDKLRAKGDKLWAEAIIAIKGNIIIEWEYVTEKSDFRCKLKTGEVFEPLSEGGGK